MIEDKLKLKQRGGGVFHHIRARFSLCEESLYVARKNNILQYSTKTGLLLNSYQADTDHPIIGFDIASHNSAEILIACCENGQFHVWKTVTHFKTLTSNIVCGKLKSFCYLPSKQDDEKLEGITIRIDERPVVLLVNITKGTSKKLNLKLKGNLFMGVNRRKLLAVAEKRKIHFLSVNQPEKVISCHLTSKEHKKRYFTCLECHPEENIVITGDSEGKIILWQDVLSENPVKSIYHWHTLQVNCLAFSSSGSYFFSGGNESVLVRWNWENNQEKKFLPRLSGLVQHINVSSQSQLVAISMSDNAVRVIDSSFNDLSLIQHLVVGNNYKSGIVLDPRTKALIMNSNVGQIQFYLPNSNSLLYSMDVVGQNKLTDERNYSIKNTEVTKFAINKSGSWLATVEELQDVEYCHYELRLKFWFFDDSRQTFELNTSIEQPHQNSVQSIAFQCCNNEKDLRCVTVGVDKKFKVWHKTNVQKVNIDQTVWSCLSIGFYRDLPCNGLSFSSDGSLMGIGFGPIVTTWTPDTCELKCSLIYPGHRSDIKQIHFGTSNYCHLLVTSTKDRLSVWNLLTLTMVWTVPLEVEILLSNVMSVHMAVITTQRELFVFSPDSPNPEYSSSEILKAHNIISAALIPTELCLDNQSKWYERMEIYLVDSEKELFSISSDLHREYSEEIYDDNKMEAEASFYGKIRPNMKNSSSLIEQKKHLFIKDMQHKSIKKYLQTPIHTKIPIRLTCKSLIKSLILQTNPSEMECDK